MLYHEPLFSREGVGMVHKDHMIPGVQHARINHKNAYIEMHFFYMFTMIIRNKYERFCMVIKELL